MYRYKFNYKLFSTINGTLINIRASSLEFDINVSSYKSVQPYILARACTVYRQTGPWSVRQGIDEMTTIEASSTTRLVSPP